METLRKSTFTIEDRLFCDGYTAGHTWNGWARPYFTREVGDQIVADWIAPGAPTLHAHYDADTDTFFFADDSAWPMEPETFPGETHLVDGRPMTLYPIGNGSWIWDEIREG
jgi:hypothetical protein